MKTIISLAFGLALTGFSSLQAQEMLYQASQVALPGSSGQAGAISPGGAIAGVAFSPSTRVFVQNGTTTQIIPLPENARCMPRAANEVSGRTVVSGTCGSGYDSAVVWYWDGLSVRYLSPSTPWAIVSGVSGAGIVAGNIFPTGTPVNPAILWNGADGTALPINGSSFGQYTMGISNSGLVGLSPRPATYSVATDQVTFLPYPPGNWSTGSSNQFTMASDGTYVGTLLKNLPSSSEQIIIVWRNGSVVRELAPPAACRSPNYLDWVSSAPGNRILVQCRTDVTYNQSTYVSLPNGTFVELRSSTLGLPASGQLNIVRHSSSAGVLLGEVAGNPGVWRLSPLFGVAKATALEEAPANCTDANC